MQNLETPSRPFRFRTYAEAKQAARDYQCVVGQGIIEDYCVVSYGPEDHVVYQLGTEPLPPWNRATPMFWRTKDSLSEACPAPVDLVF